MRTVLAAAILALLPLGACTRASDPPPDAAGNAGTSNGADGVATAPSLPAFTAVAHDGTPRTRDDLLGTPTVLWFYPKAATSG